MSIRFTIIVPTRERSSALSSCLKNLLQQDYDNFEILVSDNFSQDRTYDLVTSFSSSLIRYINTGRRISMAHNWEFALRHVDSGWVLFIGDDDGLMQGALQTLNHIINITKCEALTATSCDYWWPEHFLSKTDGELTIPLPVKNLYEIKQSAWMLDQVMRGKAAYRELPWLYHGGAASVNLLKKLYADNGSYFQSINPDIYSAVSLALGTRTYIQVNKPIAINGASKFSGGASNMLDDRKNFESPASKFLGEDNIPFDPKLILGKSLQLYVYECYLKAAHLYNIPSHNLREQLKIALIVSPSSYFPDLLSECKLMALRNNITIPKTLEIVILRLIYKLTSSSLSIFKRPSITISASKLGAWDINLAAISAKNIYIFFEAIIQNNSVFVRYFCFSFIFLISSIKYLKRIGDKLKKLSIQTLN
jgi:glycosyltransferase involved in cell wall biosynthesis